MYTKADILENDLLRQYPKILDILLYDQTTKNNIFWWTCDYEILWEPYLYSSSISPDLITGENGHVIMPRVKKHLELQKERSRDMAEVFTPSWICNIQNNLIDNSWFGRINVFNKEISWSIKTWKTNTEKITFPKWKTWKEYVRDIRLEIACWEAPYITSRYDTTTGEFISVDNRVGILDRKLRIITENTSTSREWLDAAQIAYKSTYWFEWQWDNLLLAREALLITFIENYVKKFWRNPSLRSIQSIAIIISWNIWQMDGIKWVIPWSCKSHVAESMNLFWEVEAKHTFCDWCLRWKIQEHNGVYSTIMDWSKKKPIRFIDLITE